MNTIALRHEQWGQIVLLFESIQSSSIYKKLLVFIRLSMEAIKTGDNLALKKFMVELASAFFNIEIEEEPGEDNNKKRSRRKIMKRIVKVILFPWVLLYIVVSLLLEKKRKKVKNKNVYIKT